MRPPHTGSRAPYDSSVKRIAAAAITMEDAAMLHRMQARGQKIVVRLQMEAETLPDAPSRNVMGELAGREAPDEVVVFGGHVDSWDVGTGAMDDGGGMMIAWQAVRLLKKLGLRPRRTIRAVGWTNEENGGRGGGGCRAAHQNRLGVEEGGARRSAPARRPVLGGGGGGGARPKKRGGPPETWRAPPGNSIAATS